MEEVHPKTKYPLWQKNCKCGAPLAFGLTSNRDKDGNRIRVPLDLRAPVYVVLLELSRLGSDLEVVQTEMAFVSHFTTCKYADEFSKTKK